MKAKRRRRPQRARAARSSAAPTSSATPRASATAPRPPAPRRRQCARVRQRDEPLFHYGYRLIGRAWSELARAGQPAIACGAIEERLRGAAGPPRAALRRHRTGDRQRPARLAPHLDQPARSGRRRLRCAHLHGPLPRAAPAAGGRRDADKAASKVFEHVLAQLLFESRYEPAAGYCREYQVHWGAPLDACAAAGARARRPSSPRRGARAGARRPRSATGWGVSSTRSSRRKAAGAAAASRRAALAAGLHQLPLLHGGRRSAAAAASRRVRARWPDLLGGRPAGAEAADRARPAHRSLRPRGPAARAQLPLRRAAVRGGHRRQVRGWDGPTPSRARTSC